MSQEQGANVQADITKQHDTPIQQLEQMTIDDKELVEIQKEYQAQELSLQELEKQMKETELQFEDFNKKIEMAKTKHEELTSSIDKIQEMLNDYKNQVQDIYNQMPSIECENCKKKDYQYMYSECGHLVCDGECYQNNPKKCPICKVDSECQNINDFAGDMPLNLDDNVEADGDIKPQGQKDSSKKQ